MRELIESALRHHQAGQLDEAQRLYDRVLAGEPANNHVLYLLSVLSQQLGRQDAAVDFVRRSIALAPDVADYHLHLGSLLMTAGDYGGAGEAFRRVRVLQPQLIDALSHLGNAMYMSRDLDGAILAYQDFLAARPQSPEVLNNLGTALRETGRLDEALVVYRKALDLRPDLRGTWQNLGHTLLERHDARQAAMAYQRAVELRPTSADAHFDLGKALKEAGMLDDSIVALSEAVRLRPGWLEPLGVLGSVLHATARMDEALACHEKLLENGNDPVVAAGLLHSLYFNSECRPERILRDHRRWNELYARSLAPASPAYSNRRDPDRRLRIGYVSADFCLHASSLFTLPLMRNHNRELVEVFCYSGAKRADELTELHRRCADGWRNIWGVADEEAAELVRRDQIDVLVDLSLHSAGSRLLVFARKPAPVQVTWLAYPGTSGLDVMDYRLSDPYLDPPGADQWYTERTIRLPDCFWCYDPLSDQPPVGSPPFQRNGYVTFGSLNSFAKVSSDMLDRWAEALAATPGSQMMIYAPEGESRRRVLERLGRRGIDASRIEFVARQARTPYLETYGRIDISLDTWPYNGGTTSLDSLSMGVPVVTRCGPTAVGRGGLSILSNLGLSDLVAQRTGDFAAIAATLACDPQRLSTLRSELRQCMRNSALMNAPRFARNVEAAYRQMWTKRLTG